MSDNQERDEAHTGGIYDDSIATGQEHRTRLYDRDPPSEKHYREEAAADIVNWTITQGVEDYSDKSFGTFVMNVIEREEYEDLMEAQRFFEFLTGTWAKAATTSLDQIVSARTLDSNVQAEGVDYERGAWKKYYLDKLKKQEDECRHSLSRTKARLERENKECLAELTHKQSTVMDSVRAEIRQTSSEATEVIAHLAEDTIISITSTVTCIES